MNTRIINSKLFSKLTDKEYRRLFIASQINKGIPFQIRALRAAREMKQSDLAELAETTQTVISRIENKGASNLTVQTLVKLAEAFDVALVVRFEPIDKLIEWVDDLSPEKLSPEPSDKILAELRDSLDEVPDEATSTQDIKRTKVRQRKASTSIEQFSFNFMAKNVFPIFSAGSTQGQVRKEQLGRDLKVVLEDAA